MRGPPWGTQKVCTVPSLRTIWGHGGGGNKVTFQRFLVQRRKANAVVSWTYKSCTLLFPESAFPAWCHLWSPAPQFILPSTFIQWLLPTLGVSLLGHSIHLVPFV